MTNNLPIQQLQIQNDLLAFISEQSDAEGPFEITDDLLEESILDSLLITDLALHLETTYGVSLGVGDIAPAKLRSVERIGELVMKKLAKRAA